ncbi:Hypothetical protein PBC10988_23050 [Planctomycetales bacterium 10988]|nr:Hypothetical protein PBC10988_23050 [Planctomycetales bacterium 10988]
MKTRAEEYLVYVLIEIVLTLNSTLFLFSNFEVAVGITYQVLDHHITEEIRTDGEQAFQEHLDQVERVQEEQREILKGLIEKHRLKVIYLEGLTEEDLPIFQAILAAMKRRPEKIPREQWLRVGAAGKLFIEGVIEEIRPAEDLEAYLAADPVQPDGSIVIDLKKQEAREAAIVRRLVDPINIIVLGQAHDLSDHIKPPDRYLRIAPKSLPRLESANKKADHPEE